MQAVWLALAGFFSFTLMDLSIKALLQDYALLQVTFFNCLFAFLGLLLWAHWSPGGLKQQLRTTHPRLHLLRAVLVLVADLLAFYSFGQVPLAEAYTLILTMPLFTVLFAWLLKQEVLSPQQLLVSAIGFVGVFLVLSPGFSQFNVALLAALGCAIIEAFSFLLVNRYKAQESPQAFAIYSLGLVLLVTGTWTALHYQPMTGTALLISASGGLCYALASALVVTAFHRGIPSHISSMQYSQLVWGMLLAFLIWQELPSWNAVLGGLLISVASVWLLRQRAATVPAPQ